VAGGYWYVHSSGFQQRVAAIFAGQIRINTGAIPEFGRFHFSFRPLALDLHNVVLHGREGPTQPPLATIAHLYIGLTLTSLLHPNVNLTQTVLDRPTFHIYSMADGSLNLPTPPSAQTTPRQGAAQPLFNLGARSVLVNGGEVDVNDRRIPVETDLHDVHLRLAYVAATGKQGGAYEGEFSYADSPLRLKSIGPLPQSLAMHFALWPNDLLIRDLKLDGLGSQLTAQLIIQDLNQPHVAGAYQVSADLGRAAAAVGDRNLLAGRARIAGAVHWSQKTWGLNGRISAAGVRLAKTPADLGDLSGNGSFAATPNGLDLRDLVLNGMGGSMRVAGTYRRWRDLHLTGNIEGVQFARLVAMAITELGIGSGHVSPEIFRLKGTVHGPFSADSIGPVNPNLTVHANLAVTPPAAVKPGNQPVSGDLAVTAAPFRKEGNLQHADLTLPGLAIHGGGDLRAGVVNVGVTASSPNLAQVQWLAQAIAGPRRAAKLAGSGTIRAQIAGDLAAPQVQATIAGEHIVYGPYAADSVQVVAALRAGSLTITQARAIYRGQTLALAGTIGLRSYGLFNGSALNLNASAQNLGLAQALQWSGHTNLQGTGTVNARVRLTGTKAAPVAAAAVQLLNARVTAKRLGAQQIRSATADVAYKNGTVSSNDLKVVLVQSQIAGAFSYTPATQAYTVNVASQGLNLTEIAAVESARLPVSGTVQFQLDGRGTLQRPSATLRLTGTNLIGAGEPLGTLKAVVEANGTTATLQAMDTLPAGSASADGRFGLQSPYPMQAVLNLRDYDFDAWLRRFTNLPLSGHNIIGGEVTLSGPLATPALLAGSATINPLHMAVAGLSFDNSGPMLLSIARQTLTVLQARLIGPNTNFAVGGTAQLRKAGALNLNVNGSLNLAVLELASSTIHSSGQLTVAAQVGGTVAAPKVNGGVQIRGGTLAAEGVPVAFDNIEGNLLFSGNRLQIQQLTMHTGGGTLQLLGYAGYSPAAGPMADITAEGKNVRVRYQGVSATSDVHLRLTAQNRYALISGHIALNRIALTSHFDLGSFVAFERTAFAAPSPTSPLNRIRFEIHLVTGPQLEIAYSQQDRLQLVADLMLQGTAEIPILLGRINGSEGTLLFAGNTYTVSKANVLFANPIRIDPILDMSFSTVVQQYDITLDVTGSVDKLNVSYRSDPPLANADIIALLATGQTQEQGLVNNEAAQTFTSSSEQIIGSAMSNFVAGRFARIFGITQLQVNPNLSGNSPTNDPTFTVKQQVRRNVSVTYSQYLAGQGVMTGTQEAVQLEWHISRRLSITFSRDEFGLYGIALHRRVRAR
jgi:translocation and assembly module TamB